MKKQLTIEDYLKMPHTIILKENSDGSYFAKIAEFPGCMTEGQTKEEALDLIMEAKELWIESELEMDHDIPLPASLKEYSGKFNVRIPSSLHKELAILADQEGVSLNQYVSILLAKNMSLSYVEERFKHIEYMLHEQKQQNTSISIMSGKLNLATPFDEPAELDIPRYFLKGELICQ